MKALLIFTANSVQLIQDTTANECSIHDNRWESDAGQLQAKFNVINRTYVTLTPVFAPSLGANCILCILVSTAQAWILNIVRDYSLAYDITITSCDNSLHSMIELLQSAATCCNSNFPPLFLSSFSPPKGLKPTAWKKCLSRQRFGAVGCKSDHVWRCKSDHECKSDIRGNSRKLRSVPSLITKSITFVTARSQNW